VSKGRREFYTHWACRLENKRVRRDAETRIQSECTYVRVCIVLLWRERAAAGVNCSQNICTERDEHKSSRGRGGGWLICATPVQRAHLWLTSGVHVHTARSQRGEWAGKDRDGDGKRALEWLWLWSAFGADGMARRDQVDSSKLHPVFTWSCKGRTTIV
jgi:hypothetical protein